MIYIITGDIETGKSEALLRWTKGQSNVHGILTPRNSENQHFFLNVKSNESFKMLASPEDKSIISVGRYHFLKAAFIKANTILKLAINKINSGYIVIDEMGKLELKSEGLHESALLAIQKVKTHNDVHVILVIRTTLLKPIIEKYNLNKAVVLTKNEISLTLPKECNISYNARNKEDVNCVVNAIKPNI